MPTLNIIMEGDGAFPYMKPQELGRVSAIARLPQGMRSGKSSVCVEVTLPDGSRAYGQTSLELFLGAAQAFKTKEGL